jgi:hypothetical protein
VLWRRRAIWTIISYREFDGAPDFLLFIRRPVKILQFAAIILTALALVPAGAFFFEMPNKIGLSRDQYFAVQQICRGWNLFGIVLISTIAANLALTIALWKRRRAFWFAVIGLGLVIGSLTIFFLWTYPANEATQNWTTIPGNWQQLRQQWEIAHAASALLTFGALCAVKLVVYALRAP